VRDVNAALLVSGKRVIPGDANDFAIIEVRERLAIGILR